jgi:hypothetical protein
LFNENSSGEQLLGSPHFSGVLTHPVHCLLIWWGFFCGEGRVSLSRGLCCFIPGVAVGILCEAYLLTCWFAGCLPNRLEPASSCIRALLFSQCNVAWRNFVQAGSSGCWCLDSSWCFFLPSVAPASQ